VLLGSKSWSDFHSELKLGGQREAVIESLGGGITKAVAGKAWKAAQAAAVKDFNPRGKTGGGDRGGKRLTCYWCASGQHKGINCPSKRANKPPAENSRAMKWPKKDRDRAMKNAAHKIKIDKP